MERLTLIGMRPIADCSRDAHFVMLIDNANDWCLLNCVGYVTASIMVHESCVGIWA